MASSLPGVLDYLHQQIPALPAVQQLRPVVADGWPDQRGDVLIALGVVPEEDEAGVVATYAELSREEYEEVTVPSIIAVRRSGANAASRARADAFALFDAIRELVRSDRRCGGAIVPGMPARIVSYDVAQTSRVQQAGEGRTCEIRWILTWQHRG